MTPRQIEICDLMRRALVNIPCACQHNVPYAGGQVEQVVTVQCQRCKAIEAHAQLVEGTP